MLDTQQPHWQTDVVRLLKKAPQKPVGAPTEEFWSAYGQWMTDTAEEWREAGLSWFLRVVSSNNNQGAAPALINRVQSGNAEAREGWHLFGDYCILMRNVIAHKPAQCAA